MNTPKKFKDLPNYFKGKAKIIGDAGVYEVWGVNFYGEEMYINRTCCLELVSFKKIQWYKPDIEYTRTDAIQIDEEKVMWIIFHDGKHTQAESRRLAKIIAKAKPIKITKEEV